LSLKQYSVTAKTLGGVSPAWLFTVKPLTPPLTIDTSPLSLSGHLVRYGRTPTHPPAGTTTTRSASGGTPPYRYAKSTDAVNLDTATGTVISFRNGQATITVTDANGQQASYNVSVSNVLELDGYSGNSIYRDSTTHAANYGGRIPTLQEWQELRATYGGSPALPPAEADENAWSTTSAGGINYTTISPNKGTTGIQPDVLVVIGGRGLAKGWAIVTRYAK
jgi:hypothetical protein